MSVNFFNASENLLRTEEKQVNCPHLAKTSQASIPFMPVITGWKSELWQRLSSTGLIDQFGDPTHLLCSKNLSELEVEELDIIKNELNQKFNISFDYQNRKETIEISASEILEWLMQEVQTHGYRIKKTTLVGGYVVSLLFSKTSYVERNLKRFLSDELLIKKCCDYLKKRNSRHSDIDLRIFIEKVDPFPPLPSSHVRIQYMKKEEFEIIRDKIILRLAQHYLNKKKTKGVQIDVRAVAQAIQETGFDALCEVSCQQNSFSVLDFKGTPFELIICNHLQRNNLFENDSLFIAIDPWFRGNKKDIIPQSNNKSPFAAFFSVVLGLIKAENPETIDAKGWFRFQKLITENNFSAQLRQNRLISLEEQLFKTMFSSWIRDNDSQEIRLCKFNIELKKWLHKHLRNRPLDQFFWLLNLCSSFDKHGEHNSKDADFIIKNQLQLVKPSHPIAGLIQSLLIEAKLPLRVVLDFLTVSAYMIHIQNESYRENISIDILYENFENPVFQLQFEDQTLILEIYNETILKRIIDFCNSNPKLWESAESQLFKLLDLLSPHCFQKYKRIEHCVIDAFSFSDSHILANWLETPSPLLTAIGLQLSMCSAHFTDYEIQKFAAKRCFDLLKGVKDPQVVTPLLENCLGKNLVPNIAAVNSEEMWIRQLFESKNNLQDIALELWKEQVHKQGFFKFSQDLILQFAFAQPEYVLSMLVYLNNQGLFSSAENKEEALLLLVGCGEKILAYETRRFAHDCLLVYVIRKISDIYAKKFKATKQVQSIDLSKILNWASNFFSDDTGFQLANYAFDKKCLNFIAWEGVKLSFLAHHLSDSAKRKQFRDHFKSIEREQRNSDDNLFFFLLIYFENIKISAEKSEIPQHLIEFFIAYLKIGEISNEIASRTCGLLPYFFSRPSQELTFNRKIEIATLLHIKKPDFFPSIFEKVRTMYMNHVLIEDSDIVKQKRKKIILEMENASLLVGRWLIEASRLEKVELNNDNLDFLIFLFTRLIFLGDVCLKFKTQTGCDIAVLEVVAKILCQLFFKFNLENDEVKLERIQKACSGNIWLSFFTIIELSTEASYLSIYGEWNRGKFLQNNKESLLIRQAIFTHYIIHLTSDSEEEEGQNTLRELLRDPDHITRICTDGSDNELTIQTYAQILLGSCMHTYIEDETDFVCFRDLYNRFITLENIIEQPIESLFFSLKAKLTLSFYNFFSFMIKRVKLLKPKK